MTSLMAVAVKYRGHSAGS